jgi:hypothetical protein
LLATKRIARQRCAGVPPVRPQALKRQEFGTLWSGACEYTNYPPNKPVRHCTSIRRIACASSSVVPARSVAASCTLPHLRMRRACVCQSMFVLMRCRRPTLPAVHVRARSRTYRRVHQRSDEDLAFPLDEVAALGENAPEFKCVRRCILLAHRVARARLAPASSLAGVLNLMRARRIAQAGRVRQVLRSSLQGADAR